MNRIILIGNGFDLAHKLETGYTHFIRYYLNTIAAEYFDGIKDGRFWVNQNEYERNDVIVPIKIPINPSLSTYSDLKEHLLKHKSNVIFNNKFFELLVEKTELKKWVDVEEEYFFQLKDIIYNKSNYFDGKKGKIVISPIQHLKIDFQEIKQYLENYLTSQLEGFNSPFNLENLSQKFNLADFTSDGVFYIKEEYFSKTEANIIKITSLIERMSKVTVNNYDSFNIGIYPDNILFLNFNYTNLPTKIMEEIWHNSWHLDNWAKTPMSNISIHGELNKQTNSMIFGYGDEDDEIHKEIEKRGGDYLENIKTINYTKTPNYKKLLSYIESDNYQIFIWGHSCGLSDKTLLKTLFEHKNCVSIKPFYYEDGEGHNNYDDIVKNIYRVFSDKAMMRDKVVNKEFCSQLIQYNS